MGHTWVKLRKYDKDDKLLAEHSFGFYPLERYNRPELAVPGEVVYNDTQHDKDAVQGAEYYDLTAAQYSDALTTALRIMQKRPDYKLIDYNCTAFAKDVVEAAGQQFPGKAFMWVPSGEVGTVVNAVSAVTGMGSGKALNPNALYEQMQPRATLISSGAQPPQSGLSQGASFGDREETSESDVDISSNVQQPVSQGGVFSSGTPYPMFPDETSESKNPVDILNKWIGRTLTLTQDIMARPIRSLQEVDIKTGTAITLEHVYGNFNLAEFQKVGDGYYDTRDLVKLCAALDLIS